LYSAYLFVINFVTIVLFTLWIAVG